MFTRYTRRFDRLAWWKKLIVGILAFCIADYFMGWGICKNWLSLEEFEGQPKSQPKSLTCTMYYTDWCGYCKKTKPEWSKLEAEFNGKTINGKQVIITKVNCEEYPDVAKEQNIQGYPTFKFKLAGQDIGFDGERTYDGFKSFINKIIA